MLWSNTFKCPDICSQDGFERSKRDLYQDRPDVPSVLQMCHLTEVTPTGQGTKTAHYQSLTLSSKRPPSHTKGPKNNRPFVSSQKRARKRPVLGFREGESLNLTWHDHRPPTDQSMTLWCKLHTKKRSGRALIWLAVFTHPVYKGHPVIKHVLSCL